jgi:hypothetical protein
MNIPVRMLGVDGIDVKMEGKPHPYGLLNYLAAQRLQYSGVPHCG